MPKKRFNPIYLVAVFTVLLALAAVILTLIFKPAAEKPVEILVAPASATITIDGKPYQNGTYNLKAGTINVHIEKPDFITQDFAFDTTKSDKLYTYLLQTDGTFSWYETHETDDLLLSTIGDYQALKTADTYTASHPAIQNLPIIYADYDEQYNYTEFRIDGGKFDGCSSDFCLKVTDTTGSNLDLAKSLLTEKGINPANYEILYEYKPITLLD